MAEFLTSPVANFVLMLALAAALIASGVYLISRVRASVRNRQPPSSDWMTNFRELHAQGELTDEEYRTIKAVLAERLEQELNSTDEPC